MRLETFYQKELIEAGCDEAGRGCYAGPVFAAAVILPEEFEHPLLNDSKQVKEADRVLLRQYIELYAKAWAVAKVDVEEIDRINILKASFLAMHRAISNLNPKPGFLIIDGNRFEKYHRIPHTCVVKGDSKFASVAAASILAKTHRDEWMKNLHTSFPKYHWNKNKGYGTADHRTAIQEYGLCVHHRKSFNIGWEQQELF
jgi:ribonuclease HII